MKSRNYEIYFPILLFSLLLFSIAGCGGGGKNNVVKSGTSILAPSAPKYPRSEIPIDHTDGMTIYWGKPSTFDDGSTLTTDVKYCIYKNDIKIQNSISTTSFTDINILGGISKTVPEYTYYITAVSGSGIESVKSSEISIITQPAVLFVNYDSKSSLNEPFKVNTSVGSYFYVLIRVEKVTNLFSASFEISFNNLYLEVAVDDSTSKKIPFIYYDTDLSNPSIENFLEPVSYLYTDEINQNFPSPQTINKNSIGKFVINCSLKLEINSQETDDGVSGSGYIALIKFKAKNKIEETMISFNSVYLYTDKIIGSIIEPIEECENPLDSIKGCKKILWGNLKVKIQ